MARSRGVCLICLASLAADRPRLPAQLLATRLPQASLAALPRRRPPARLAQARPPLRCRRRRRPAPRPPLREHACMRCCILRCPVRRPAAARGTVRSCKPLCTHVGQSPATTALHPCCRSPLRQTCAPACAGPHPRLRTAPTVTQRCACLTCKAAVGPCLGRCCSGACRACRRAAQQAFVDVVHSFRFFLVQFFLMRCTSLCLDPAGGQRRHVCDSGQRHMQRLRQQLPRGECLLCALCWAGCHLVTALKGMLSGDRQVVEGKGCRWRGPSWCGFIPSCELVQPPAPAVKVCVCVC